MARKKVPPTAGAYTVIFEFPGDKEWAEDVHASFNEWTLKLAQEGPSDSVAILPAFEVVDETDEDPAALKLTYVQVPADFGWEAITKSVENLEIIAPDLLRKGAAMRVTVGAERLVGMEIEVEVPDEF